MNNAAHEANSIAITQLNGIRSLIYVLNGAIGRKRYVIQCLGNLAIKSSARRIEIVLGAAIPSVCQLALYGNDKEKRQSAFGLQNLSVVSAGNCKSIAEYGGIKALAAMEKDTGNQQIEAIEARTIFRLCAQRS